MAKVGFAVEAIKATWSQLQVMLCSSETQSLNVQDVWGFSENLGYLIWGSLKIRILLFTVLY